MSLAVITAYFNFFNRESRIENFCRFREKILASGTQLISIELESEAPLPEPLEGELRVKIAKAGLLWQKEALWQRGIQVAKANGFKKVLLLDADVFYPNNNSLQQIESLLDYYEILHPWDISLHSYEDGTWNMRKSIIQIFEEFGNVDAYRRSGAYVKDLNKAVEISLAHSVGCRSRQEIRNLDEKVLSSPGYGIGLSGRALENLKFYPYAIVGGGDLINLALLFMCLKLPEMSAQDIYQKYLSDPTKWIPESFYNSFCNWIHREAHTCDYKMGSAPGVLIVSLSHGVLESRNYHNRQRMLEIDFSEDVFHYTEDGALDWVKKDTPLAMGVRRYFIERSD